MLMQYFKGEQQQFEIIPVDLDSMSEFRRRVLDLIRSIPFGVVKSYAGVARMVGSPGAARAVGGALASNSVPIIIPCHRVIAANGRLTGFTAPGGLEMKKYLLQMEHVEFKGELICQVK
jgi:methylated-DNA-[protein]-cysteine S-methyltransferase